MRRGSPESARPTYATLCYCRPPSSGRLAKQPNTGTSAKYIQRTGYPMPKECFRLSSESIAGLIIKVVVLGSMTGNGVTGSTPRSMESPQPTGPAARPSVSATRYYLVSTTTFRTIVVGGSPSTLTANERGLRIAMSLRGASSGGVRGSLATPRYQLAVATDTWRL
jgi:hypothetical protein